MKYLIILLIGFGIGHAYGYIKGYVKGYDNAKEAYESFCEKVIELYKTEYHKLLEKYHEQKKTNP